MLFMQTTAENSNSDDDDNESEGCENDEEK